MEIALQSLDPAEVERRMRSGTLRILDVREPDEFAHLGHIPGAILLPLGLIAAAPATLTMEGPPLLVCCEHGIRSAQAARFLKRAGFDGVLNMAGGMSCWRGPRDFALGDGYAAAGPSSWLVENSDLLPPGGLALDLACGAGRHALLLAAAGFRVLALDRDAARVASLRASGARLALTLRAEVVDLEASGVDLGRDAYDLILGVHYLHRPLFPSLLEALAPGGLLLYETFTVDQAKRSRPTNPAFLLEHGELRRLVAPLEVLRERDGVFESRSVASIAARRPAA